jgi:putative membrane protein
MYNEVGLNLPLVLSSIVYALLGFVIMVIAFAIFDRIFGFNIKREVLEEHNMALAVTIAGATIGIAIIVAAAIS